MSQLIASSPISSRVLFPAESRSLGGRRHRPGARIAHVGKAINPLNCAAQIEGGVVMGIGSALHEEMIIDATGKVRNPSFLDYHLVTSVDYPELIPIIVECAEPEGLYGAKGLGESGLARRYRRAHVRSAAQTGKCFLGAAKNKKNAA